jgi:hypothetical protein
LGTAVLFGRLIRVGNRGESAQAIYVVAEADPAAALEIIRRELAGPYIELEDLGRVSEGLLKALDLQPGQFIRT